MFQSVFNFPFYFFFDSLVFQQWAIQFPCICKFSSFPLVIDFYFHTIVVKNIVNIIPIYLICWYLLCGPTFYWLKNIIRALGKNVHAAASGQNVLYMSVKFRKSIMLFKSTVCLSILCLDDLSIFESGVLKCTSIIVLLFISVFSSITMFFYI